MNKTLITASLLSVALLASPVSQAAGYQDRAAATGAVVGATTGAIVGANHDRPVEGAVVGAVLGSIVGIVIASNRQPGQVVYAEPHRNPMHRAAFRHDHHRCSHDSAYFWRMHKKHERMERRREHARDAYWRHECREDAREHRRHDREQARSPDNHYWNDRS